MVESLVAVSILGVAVVAALVALSTGSLAVSTVDQQAKAQGLVRSQLEDIKAAPYAPTYSTIAEPGYDVSVNVNPLDDNLQKIAVTISRGGEVLLVVETYKVNR